MSSTSSLSSGFTTILTWLCRAIAARAAHQPAIVPVVRLVWGRLQRLSRRLQALAAKMEAGTLKPPPTRSTPANRPPAAKPRKPALPRGFAWLAKMAPETRVFGSQLQALLDDPQMTALLETAPQTGRLLRPLCHMLGVHSPPMALAKPERKPPAPKGVRLRQPAKYCGAETPHRYRQLIDRNPDLMADARSALSIETRCRVW